METTKSDVSTTNQNALPHDRDGRGYYGASVEVAQATESDGVEIVEAVKVLSQDLDNIHRPLHIGHEGTSSFFEEFHTTKEEACDLICKQLGI